jgi:hypothetical protein
MKVETVQLDDLDLRPIVTKSGKKAEVYWEI